MQPSIQIPTTIQYTVLHMSEKVPFLKKNVKSLRWTAFGKLEMKHWSQKNQQKTPTSPMHSGPFSFLGYRHSRQIKACCDLSQNICPNNQIKIWWEAKLGKGELWIQYWNIPVNIDARWDLRLDIHLYPGMGFSIYAEESFNSSPPR